MTLDAPLDHPLLGHRVQVTLARAGDIMPPSTSNNINLDLDQDGRLTHDITMTGCLVRLDADGGFWLVKDDGTTTGGWPALDITEEPT